MARPKKDYMKMAENFNNFRLANQNKTFTRPEIYSELQKIGFPSKIVGALISRGKIESAHIDKETIYSMSSNPLHKDMIATIYNDQRYEKAKPSVEDSYSEEKVIKQLQAAGYQIRKCVGFDTEAFAKDHPELYKKYLKYEII